MSRAMCSVLNLCVLHLGKTEVLCILTETPHTRIWCKFEVGLHVSEALTHLQVQDWLEEGHNILT